MFTWNGKISPVEAVYVCICHPLAVPSSQSDLSRTTFCKYGRYKATIYGGGRELK